ncbi:MAG: phosphate/phosphite/phosphonate ABC transporter substrate-binding protein [Planctomycetota bacterium]
MTSAVRTSCLFIALLVLSIVGCNDATPTSTTPAQESAGSDPRQGWPEVIRLGLIPSEGGADIVARFAPMAAHLEAEIGVPVETFSASEYIGVITAMQNKQVDVAYFGPKSYVEANRIAGAVAVARELNDQGQEGYYGIIITRQGSGISTLEEARGQTFGFVTPNSTSGFLVPSIGIIELTGMRPEAYFGEIRYTGSHGSAIRAVLAGDLPIAATNTLDLIAMEQSGLDSSPLVELWRSELIPSSPIAVRGDLPQSFQDAVRDAVVSLSSNPKALEAMARGGFVPGTDTDFDPIRALEQRRQELIDGG